jgi:hypothetical protein
MAFVIAKVMMLPAANPAKNIIASMGFLSFFTL